MEAPRFYWLMFTEGASPRCRQSRSTCGTSAAAACSVEANSSPYRSNPAESANDGGRRQSTDACLREASLRHGLNHVRLPPLHTCCLGPGAPQYGTARCRPKLGLAMPARRTRFWQSLKMGSCRRTTFAASSSAAGKTITTTSVRFTLPRRCSSTLRELRSLGEGRSPPMDPPAPRVLGKEPGV